MYKFLLTIHFHQVCLMEMDLCLIALLLVLVVHCQSTRINLGAGRQHILSTLNGRKYFRMFTGHRYLPQNRVLQDTFRQQNLHTERCLLMCHQHNQNSQCSDPRCIAVNFCPSTSNCQLNTDTERVPRTSPRCILLSAALVPGENEDNVVSQDFNWQHFADYSNYYQLAGAEHTCRLTISNGVTKDYYYYFGHRYMQANRVIQDMIRKGGTSFTAEDCLKKCYVHNQRSQHRCLAVSYCRYSKNCRLPNDTDSVPTQFSRCILLSAGVALGTNANGLREHDPNWDHYVDNNA